MRVIVALVVHLSIVQLRQNGTYADSKCQADYLRRVAGHCGITLTAVKQDNGGWLLAVSPRSRRRRRRSRRFLTDA
jgi:hypothetical protein